VREAVPLWLVLKEGLRVGTTVGGGVGVRECVGENMAEKVRVVDRVSSALSVAVWVRVGGLGVAGLGVLLTVEQVRVRLALGVALRRDDGDRVAVMVVTDALCWVGL
jgi:hypothetical protein